MSRPRVPEAEVRSNTCNLPAGWVVETSRSTGKKYFFNTINGVSTYEFNEVFQSINNVHPEKLLPPQLHHGDYNSSVQRPAIPPQHQHLQRGHSLPVNNNLHQHHESLFGLSHELSVSQLKMMLEEKKRKLQELVEGRVEEDSSVDSGLGSQGGAATSESQEESRLKSAFGEKLSRRVNLRHQQNMKTHNIEAKKQRVDEDAPAVSDHVKDRQEKVHSDEVVEEIYKKDDIEDVEDDEEDMYGADEDELELFVKMKDKFKDDSDEKEPADSKDEKETEDVKINPVSDDEKEEEEQDSEVVQEQEAEFSEDEDELRPQLLDPRFSSDSESAEDYSSDY